MIKFDATLFKCDYVKLKKVTSTYLYVVSDLDGNVYKTETSIRDKFKKRDITKVRIHENVSRQYFKNNSVKEFQDTGIYACIAYYGDIVVGVEVQSKLRKVSANKQWISVIEKVMSQINLLIPSRKDVFINGKDIFWVDDDAQINSTNALHLDEKGDFKLQKVKYLSLSRIGVEVSENTTSGKYDEKKEDDEDLNKKSISVLLTIGSTSNISSKSIRTLNFDENYAKDNSETTAVAFLKESLVLNYSPNRNDPYPIECYSPILAFEDSVSLIKNEKDFNQVVSQLQSLNNVDDKAYLNLNFALNAGKSIGDLYGFEETEILNIAKIIKDTKIVSFEKIHEVSRIAYPIELKPFDGLAWLFRFIHKEKDLNAMRDLTNLFNKIMKTGFVNGKSIKSPYKNGKSSDDIRLLKYTSKYTANNLV